MAPRRSYLVNEVARITGVSVRALHHYDEIGLLVPRERSDAGYRRYDDADLLRLQQILIGREQGLTLEEIRRSGWRSSWRTPATRSRPAAPPTPPAPPPQRLPAAVPPRQSRFFEKYQSVVS